MTLQQVKRKLSDLGPTIIRDNMKTYFYLLPVLAFILALICLPKVALGGELKYAVIPQDGFVPDKSTAIKIAEAVWIPIYGQKQIESEKPFQARLSGEVWIVEGTLPRGDEGGVALAEISKSDGRIIRVTHGQ